MKIAYIPENLIAPLYNKHTNRLSPEPAYIQVDYVNGTISAHVWDFMNGVKRNTLAWNIPPRMSAWFINQLMDKIAPYAKKIVNGYSVGAEGTHPREQYTRTAIRAIDEIDCIIHAFLYEDNLLDSVYDAPDSLMAWAGINQLEEIAADAEYDWACAAQRLMALARRESANETRFDFTRETLADALKAKLNPSRQTATA